MTIAVDNAITTPVAFIIFNRVGCARRVLEAIRAARPSRLFVIADGPRPDIASDMEQCAATRRIIDDIDWPCQISRRLRDRNVGLRRNVLEGLDWVFEQTERAIILEDDCLPNPGFFRFCEELLQRYAQDRRVGAISGANLDPAHNVPLQDESYYFSRFCHVWGWATWRRAWQVCDHAMKKWPALRRTDWLKNKCMTSKAENFWRRHFDDSYACKRDSLNTWDVPWVFSCWTHDLVTIIPRTNLITNIGFGPEATHTRSQTRAAQLSTTPVRFPLSHPETTDPNTTADRHIQANFFEGITRWQRLYWKLRLPLPIWLVRRVRRWLGG